jgi:hypothetical protein
MAVGANMVFFCLWRVCTCVCVWLCKRKTSGVVYAALCRQLYVYVVDMHVFISTCVARSAAKCAMHVCMYACMYLCMFVCLCALLIHTYIHTYIHRCMHSKTSKQAPAASALLMHTYMHTHIHAYIGACTAKSANKHQQHELHSQHPSRVAYSTC